ncbi:MAG: nucleotide sugar dehydrogenase, partial [Gemmatimonadota bacterium]
MNDGISVFGLGYVGCVSAACFAQEGHDVVGVDVNASKVEMIREGRSPVVEPAVADIVAAQVGAGRLTATTDAAEAVRRSDISLVCVGTPSRTNGDIDLRYVERVCEQIGEALRQKPDDEHIVVIRSTVLPGSIEEVVIPALERASGRAIGSGLGVCMNPEFLREGSSVQDFYDPPFTLIGTADAAVADRIADLYEGVDAPVRRTGYRTAEMVKYACNAFHALKVGFANEIGRICKPLRIDSREVMEIFCRDTRLNISSAYLKPGFAFGGSCLPKDLRAITYRAKQMDVDAPVLRAALDSNRRHVERAVELVLATGKRRIGVLGMAFKAGTDDLRESPVVTLIETLLGKGMDLSIYDHDVSRSRLLGANRDYIERQVPHIWSLVRGRLDDVLERSEVIILGNRSDEFRTAVQAAPNASV